MGFDAAPVRGAYAAMAEEYAARFADDLATDPCRDLLDDALDRMDPRAPLLDLGCGPGTVASVLVAGGRRAVGLDLTMAMLAVAARRLPGLPLVAGDVLALALRSAAVGGAVAWFSLHNLPRPALSLALGELHRVLRPGGILVVATHVGSGEERVGEVVLTYYERNELAVRLREAAFDVLAARTRPPRPHEHQMPKVVVVAQAA